MSEAGSGQTSQASPSVPEFSANAFGKALLRGAGNFASDGCFNHSAAISYYAMLSVIPFLSLAKFPVTRSARCG